MNINQKGTRVSHAHSRARTPLLRRRGVAGLAHSGAAKGSGAPALRLIGTAIAVATALLAIFAGSASAARPHEFTGTLGEFCTSEPCAPGKLKEPSAVAVNEATGNIYVLDQGNARVEVFDPSGTLVGEFDGSATPAGEFDFTGEGATPQTGALAVDNSCHLQGLTELTTPKCSEVDPSNGDVYVIDPGPGHTVVDKFSPTGEYLGQIVPPTNNQLMGVAVDPGGKVWLYRQEGGAVVDGYSNANTNVLVPPEIEMKALGGFALPGFAVDSSGDFYGNVLVHHRQIVKWDHTGKALIEDLAGIDSTSVAVDQTTDASFVDTGTAVEVFSPEGSLTETLGTEAGAEHLTEGAGVGIDAATGTLYVADASSATGPIVVFGPSEPSAPVIEAESFSAVDSSSATLAAEINPRSEVGEEPTTWSFQYGPCASLAACASSPYPFSTPSGTLAADFETHAVSAQVIGLAPSTTYHFRAVAHNAKGEAVPGAEVTFTTEAPGGSLLLPDGRGWELVSPPDKHGSLIGPLKETGVIEAAADGSGITYLANAPLTAAPQGFANADQILSTRGAGSWSTRDISIPHSSSVGTPFGEGVEYKFFNPELTQSAIQPAGDFNPGLSPQASESTAFLHDLSGGCGSSCYRPLVTGKAGFANVPEGTAFGEEGLCRPSPGEPAEGTCGPRFVGATDDLSHVVLGSTVPLTPGALPAGELYEWTNGALAHLSVLPNGQPAGKDSLLGFKNQSTRHAISVDGSRIVWEAGGKLYLRLNATAPQSLSGACDEANRACTIQLDSQEGCPTCLSGDGRFQVASADGSRIFFTATQRLTEDSGAVSGGSSKADLYECRIVPAGTAGQQCELTDLTPKQGEEGAAVQGGILGASEDGSTIYFVAEGALSEGTNGRGEKAVSGQPNLYLHRGGSTEFIATLAAGDEHDWLIANGTPLRLSGQPTRVSTDGRFLELMSEASLTGYDNRDRATGKPVAEVYLYDAQAGHLLCASCQPSGERPVGVEYRQIEPGRGGLAGGPVNTWPEHSLVAANVPGWTAITEGQTAQSRYQDRYLSGSGRLFFNSVNSLVPQDSNGTQDVYEFEPPGVGDCTTSLPTYSSRSGGCVSLISSGTSLQESAFLDASESGDDVFFLTSARLSPLDVDSARDVYDAHVCTSTLPCIGPGPAPAPACEGDACQPPATPPNDQTPGSLSFSGAGNVVQCPKGKVKKAGKCVKKVRHERNKGKKHKHRAKKHQRKGTVKP